MQDLTGNEGKVKKTMTQDTFVNNTLNLRMCAISLRQPRTSEDGSFQSLSKSAMSMYLNFKNS